MALILEDPVLISQIGSDAIKSMLSDFIGCLFDLASFHSAEGVNTFLDIVSAFNWVIEDVAWRNFLAYFGKDYDAYDAVVIDRNTPLFQIDIAPCPVPAGAVYVETTKNNHFYKVWRIIEEGTVVGPVEDWFIDPYSGLKFLYERRCEDVNGHYHGWDIVYRDNGCMKRATHWKHGYLDGHAYKFFNDGSLFSDIAYEDGEKIYLKNYYKNGKLERYCDCAGDGITHYYSE